MYFKTIQSGMLSSDFGKMPVLYNEPGAPSNSFLQVVPKRVVRKPWHDLNNSHFPMRLSLKKNQQSGFAAQISLQVS